MVYFFLTLTQQLQPALNDLFFPHLVEFVITYNTLHTLARLQYFTDPVMAQCGMPRVAYRGTCIHVW